ncbi:hypothetical protein BV898_07902 [Hypsibius exemplaris]|uniref:G-protein coupled receptors family 1 profile domain-containing protein n=1 Tax=Hypsibius exemplaris TaxID=2072580 RepID=A0A1W0WRY0_HYPEX|nr:hypothetical protein BV898_07902 [Hypsibius exemplaris]
MNSTPSTFHLAKNTTTSASQLQNFGVHTQNLSDFSSNTTSAEAEWKVVPVFFAVVSVTGSLGNGGALLAFIRDRTLRNPFTIHVIHLLLLNLINSLTQYPVGVVENLYSRWHLGSGICDLYLFCMSMVTAATINTHSLIALNRAWAIVHPVSYRTRNTKRFSLQLCFGLWVFLFIVEFPNWLLNALYYRRPEGCIYNSDAMPAYNAFLDIVVYTLPIAIVIASFVVVSVHKVLRSRRLAVNNHVAPLSFHHRPTLQVRIVCSL